MSATKAITLRLDSDDFEELQSEAREVGLKPAVFARLLVRAGLQGSLARSDRENALDAVGRLAQLGKKAKGERVDAVQLVREGRDQLTRRASA